MFSWDKLIPPLALATLLVLLLACQAEPSPTPIGTSIVTPTPSALPTTQSSAAVIPQVIDIELLDDPQIFDPGNLELDAGVTPTRADAHAKAFMRLPAIRHAR